MKNSHLYLQKYTPIFVLIFFKIVNTRELHEAIIPDIYILRVLALSLQKLGVNSENLSFHELKLHIQYCILTYILSRFEQNVYCTYFNMFRR